MTKEAPAVVTLIASGPGGLSLAILGEAREALNRLGADALPPTWLSEAEAADIPFADMAPDQADAIVRDITGDAKIDVIAQATAHRRKKLLIADMDSTIVTSETLDDLAGMAGVGGKIAAITNRAMAGELDFSEALRKRVGMLKGLSADVLEEAKARMEVSPGAASLVRTMRANGAYCALVSGGFTQFADAIRDKLGFDMAMANRFAVKDGALTGGVTDPILTKDAKVETLRRLAAEKGLSLAETATVGDGANDLEMTLAAGLGVAYRGKPVLRDAARARLDYADLRGMLFAQGYSSREFAD